MKINKNKKLKDAENRILLVRGEADLIDLLPDNKQYLYVKERFTADKKSVQINLLDHQLFISRLDTEKIPLNKRLEEARTSAHSAFQAINELDISKLVIVNGGVSPEECIAFAEGLALSGYQFLKYKTGDKPKPNSLKEISLHDRGLTDDHILKLENLVNAVYLTRNLVNEPLSFLTAVQLSKEIELMGEEAGFTVEIFNKKKIESLKMGGLLAVNKGSIDPPTFSVLTHKPENAINKNPIVLVGKGVVYDTGGLSLKPTHDSMDHMKCDMGGAAAVAGAIYAVVKNEFPLWIVGLIPATDNRPDGNAYVPGDVVTMYDGSTVEVLNTDAEGRMILADALSYAKQFDPEVVIELSTLTGSAQAAIDKYGIVGMGNASREVMNNLIESGDYAAERIAEFPFWDDYNEQLKSEIADLKNIGGRYGGAITAGKFLEHFTDYPYIHLDIAGPSYNKAPYNYRGKGGSGVGVRILYHYLLNRIV
ncbi:MAG: leucyl aminopeptidase [Bacteroidetes bacterium]|nr:leucyl aminopeptidase [Bacteroidota bacterium]